MQAGELRERIDIESDAGTRDSVGDKIPSWSATYASVAAKIVTPTGTEPYSANQFNGELSHIVTIRHEGRTITPLQRVKWGTRILEIKAVMADPKRTQFDLLCFERVGR